MSFHNTVPGRGADPAIGHQSLTGRRGVDAVPHPIGRIAVRQPRFQIGDKPVEGHERRAVVGCDSAANDEGQIEVYLDDPTVPANRIARIGLLDTKKLYAFSTADIEKEVTGVHDVYFVFRGTGYNVASWAFSEKDTPELPDLSSDQCCLPE